MSGTRVTRLISYDAERHVPPARGWIRDDAFCRSRKGQRIPLPAGRPADSNEREREVQESELLLLRRFGERYEELVADLGSSVRLIELARALEEEAPHAATKDEAWAVASERIDGNRNLKRRLLKVLCSDPELVELAQRLGRAA